MGASDRFSRTIPKDQIEGASQWELRPLAAGTRVARGAPLSARPSAAEREQSGYEAGRAQGYAEIMKNAQDARAADLQRLDAMLAQMQARLDELASGTADALLDLALDIAAQVLRNELQTRRDAALPVVREALSMVVDAVAHPVVRLAPKDFELVRDALKGDGQYHGCRFIADPGLQPGGCRIETPHGEIDATVATRWRRVVQTLGVEAPPPEALDPPAGTADETGPA